MSRPSSRFPNPAKADARGLVAVSDFIDVDLLLDAYSHGIFPWSNDPVCWFSPDPRAVFLRERIRTPKKLGKAIRHHGFSVSFDRDFITVMNACRAAHADKGTWIGPAFVHAYGELHRLGHAHSAEVWQDNKLVGGLYGVQLGTMFAGESMFHLVPEAGKVAFAFLVEHLDRMSITLFDAQVLNPFTVQLGAVQLRRREFLRRLKDAVSCQTPFDGQPWPQTPPALATTQPPPVGNATGTDGAGNS